MLRSLLCSGLAGVMSILLLSGCKPAARLEPKPDLRTRILSANGSQFCRLPEACFNPGITVMESYYDVTTFLGARPQHRQVLTEDLQNYLAALPMSAWPRGPVITISPSDDVVDGQAIQTNFLAAQRICRDLGLEVQIIPGG
jgi:hypothetical protein